MDRKLGRPQYYMHLILGKTLPMIGTKLQEIIW